jgi:hypothetical protein
MISVAKNAGSSLIFRHFRKEYGTFPRARITARRGFYPPPFSSSSTELPKKYQAADRRKFCDLRFYSTVSTPSLA